MLSSKTRTISSLTASQTSSPSGIVLEGREILAGGATQSRSETTGSYRMSPVLSSGAPVGAREASAAGTSPVRGCFSRPFMALPISTMGTRVGPVVAPPAHFSRASGTQSGPHPAKRAEGNPVCGAPRADGSPLAGLSLGPQDFGVQMVNANAPAFGAPHRGLCGPLSNPTPISR